MIKNKKIITIIRKSLISIGVIATILSMVNFQITLTASGLFIAALGVSLKFLEYSSDKNLTKEELKVENKKALGTTMLAMALFSISNLLLL